MSKIQCSSLLSKLALIKSTCKQSSFGKEDLASIVFNRSQIIAASMSRYTSVYFDHPLEEVRMPFDPFHQIISRFDPDSYIEVQQDGKHISIFQSNNKEKTKIKINSMESVYSQFIEWEYLEQDLIPFTEELRHAIKMIHPCLPKDTSRPNLECMYFDENVVGATDGSRASVYKLVDKLSGDFFVSILDAQAIIDAKYDWYSLHDTHLDLIGDEIFTRIGLVNPTNYPDINSIVNFNPHGSFIVDKKSFQFDLSKASLFASGEYTSNSRVELSLSLLQYKMNSKNALGKIKVNGMCESTGTIRTSVNPVFLLDAIENVPSDRVKISWASTNQGYQFFISDSNYHFSCMSYGDQGEDL